MEIDFKLKRADCPTCGVIQFYPINFVNIKRGMNANVFCANGHQFWFTPEAESPEILKERIVNLETEVQSLRKENVRLIHLNDQAGISD